MEKLAKTTEQCQICGGKNLKSIIFLGHVPLVNDMHAIGTAIAQEVFFPLEMLRCSDCTLVQNGTIVNKEVVFPREYPYLSGTTKILREDFANLYQESKEILKLKPENLIIDIGSNDGTLLVNFKEGGHQVLGIEPSRAADVANKNGIKTLMRFFNRETIDLVKKDFGKAELITAANVFAHIDRIDEVVEGIKELLTDDGVFISENHYLLDLVETIQYDTVYHEHLRYYSLYSLKKLFEQHDLEIFRVKRIPTHGGSVRVYTCRKGKREIHSSVKELLNKENEAGLTDGSIFKNFRENIIQSKTKLIALLGKIKKEKGKIYGIGAPSRASTLIAYTGIDDSLLDCVLEVLGSHKLNKYIPGTRIPVLEETKLYNDQPEYALLLSWHIADELMPKIKEKGFKGKFIIPLPEPKITE